MFLQLVIPVELPKSRAEDFDLSSAMTTSPSNDWRYTSQHVWHPPSKVLFLGIRGAKSSVAAVLQLRRDLFWTQCPLRHCTRRRAQNPANRPWHGPPNRYISLPAILQQPTKTAKTEISPRNPCTMKSSRMLPSIKAC